MRYSEAMRLGGMMYRQHFGGNVSTDGGKCANVAAMTAAGFDWHTDDIHELWPAVAGQANPPCPACGTIRFVGAAESVAGLVVHLNDAHRWPICRIADWLEEFENKSGANLTVSRLTPLVAEEEPVCGGSPESGSAGARLLV